MKTRDYYKCQTYIEVIISEGNKNLACFHYYPAKGYMYPRMHFENFGLHHADYVYEVTRFLNVVNRFLANPRLEPSKIEQIIYNESLF